MFRSPQILTALVLLSAPALNHAFGGFLGGGGSSDFDVPADYEIPTVCDNFDGASGGSVANVCLLCPNDSDGNPQYAASFEAKVSLPVDPPVEATCLEFSLVGLCGQFPSDSDQGDPCALTRSFFFGPTCNGFCAPISGLEDFIAEEERKFIAANSVSPTASPTLSPTGGPTTAPTAAPSASPTTLEPTGNPTSGPTGGPTAAPTAAPSASPTTPVPTGNPTSGPTGAPTGSPTDTPTASPTTAAPTGNPTSGPTAAPTGSPTDTPTASPTTAAPTGNPTAGPTAAPSGSPTATPTASPTTAEPTGNPTSGPTATPTGSPTAAPSASPTTAAPTGNPTAAPSNAPTTQEPTNSPTPQPTGSPTEEVLLPAGLDFSTIALPVYFDQVMANLDAVFSNQQMFSEMIMEFMDEGTVENVLTQLPTPVQNFVENLPPRDDITQALSNFIGNVDGSLASEFLDNIPGGGNLLGSLFGGNR